MCIRDRYKCYKSVLDLPKGPDAVFLAIPASQIIRTVNELNHVNAGGIVCYSAGFKEIGQRGISLEKQLVKSLKNMVLVGYSIGGLYAAMSLSKGVEAKGLVLINTLRKPSERLNWINNAMANAVKFGGTSLILDMTLPVIA